MNYGQTIEHIRRQKNLTIKDVCGEALSRHTYYRFVRNEIDISMTKFFHLIDSLNINVDEFLFINNNFKLSQEVLDIENLKYFFETQNIDSLEQLLTNYSDKSTIKRKNFHNLTAVLLSHITNKSCNNEKQELIDYLIGIETWTHYETALFNNSMFIFETEFIELVLSKVNLNLEKYSHLRTYGNDAVRMLINTVILYIDREEFQKAKNFLETIKGIKLADDCLYEKIMIIFLEEILNLLTGKTCSTEKCKKIINSLNNLNSPGTSKMLNFYLTSILQKYPQLSDGTKNNQIL